MFFQYLEDTDDIKEKLKNLDDTNENKLIDSINKICGPQPHEKFRERVINEIIETI